MTFYFIVSVGDKDIFENINIMDSWQDEHDHIVTNDFDAK